MTRYFTVEARDSSALDKKVNKQLSLGGKLQGGVTISRGEGIKSIWAQAMIENN
jgi:hypothetical protein